MAQLRRDVMDRAAQRVAAVARGAVRARLLPPPATFQRRRPTAETPEHACPLCPNCETRASARERSRPACLGGRARRVRRDIGTRRILRRGELRRNLHRLVRRGRRGAGRRRRALDGHDRDRRSADRTRRRLRGRLCRVERLDHGGRRSTRRGGRGCRERGPRDPSGRDPRKRSVQRAIMRRLLHGGRSMCRGRPGRRVWDRRRSLQRLLDVRAGLHGWSLWRGARGQWCTAIPVQPLAVREPVRPLLRSMLQVR
jgi:hypothetical protein